ncbi:hypothetical protein [Aldersonia kunmingensis]|uniref:hypothetical protein n=1 Tax=Aldersonia kunmingensis TaxID=408066 RepID=UPI00082BAD71|nr:hypothetical protein [Aldersonia kunmingensis]
MADATALRSARQLRCGVVGMIDVRIRGAFAGILSDPGMLCSVIATIRWRNLETGVAASWPAWTEHAARFEHGIATATSATQGVGDD